MNLAMRKPLRILIVEDDQVCRTLLLTMLAKSSLPISQVECTESLSAAFKLAGNNHFDVMLLDLNLPDSSGLDTLVRTSERYPNTAIVVITGWYDEEVGLGAIASGAQECLLKGSYTLEMLSKSIRYAVERKQVDRKLQLAEERYRTIFENSAVAIMVADENERLVSWNRFTETLLEMTKEDLYLRPVKTFYPPDEWEKIRAYNVIQKGMQHHVETRMVKKDGSIIDVDISLTVSRESGGKRTGSIGIVRDVTERKRIQEILDRKQKNLEAIFDAAPVGMLLVDEHMIVKRVNDAIRRMIRRKYSEIINRRIGDALGCANCSHDGKECGYDPACDACPLQNTIQTVLNLKRPAREAEIQPTLEVDGGEITPWLSISAEPTTVDGSRHVVVAVADITDRKRAEEKLNETMQIKSRFISMISHELRTPLSSVKQGIDIVLDEVVGKINEIQKSFLDIAKRNIDRLARLINDILDFQAIEAGKMRLDMQQDCIGTVAREVHKSMVSIAKQKGIDLTVELEDNLPKAIFDCDKITQVLVNLVSNAIKSIPDRGKAHIQVQRYGEELTMRVKDTGIGIPKKDLSKIFDQFYRVQSANKPIEGTGLGLAIVKRIVTMHRGRIEVDSEVGRGTTFTVFLPLDPRSVPKVSPAQADEILEKSIAD